MRNENGQVLLELALILPLLLGLVLGMADFSRAMYAKHTLGNAARSGARVAAVTSPLPPTLVPAPLLQTPGEPAQTIKQSIPFGIPPEQIRYQLQLLDSDGLPITGPVHAGNQVRVTLTYPNFPMITPFHKLIELMGGSSSTGSSISVSAQATMRYEIG